jgi:hypothetical protein
MEGGLDVVSRSFTESNGNNRICICSPKDCGDRPDDLKLNFSKICDELQQKTALTDQYVHLQGLAAAFEFHLHDLLMILITIFIIILWRAWDRIDCWPFR